MKKEKQVANTLFQTGHFSTIFVRSAIGYTRLFHLKNL